MTEYKREIFCRPAHDGRHPDSSKSRGVHGVDMVWILKGPVGAIEFVIFTNWHLPGVAKEMEQRHFDPFFFLPMPSRVTYHSPWPISDNPESRSESCDYIDGRACFCGGSACDAHDVFNVLLEHGSDGVWNEMARRYRSIFGADEEQRRNEILFRRFKPPSTSFSSHSFSSSPSS